MTIYIDVVILENLIMNSIILYVTAIIMKLKIKHIKIIISSLIGAIYSIASYITNVPIYSNFFLKIILSIVMIYIAFFPNNIKTLIKQMTIFYLTSFLFGGVAFALIYIIKPQNILMKNGLFLGTYPLKTVFIGAIIASIIIIVGFKIVKTKINKKDCLKNVKLKILSKETDIKVMLDTGNLLKEPITGAPVIIVENTALQNIIPKEILNNLEEILGGDFSKIPEDIKKIYMPKLKLIPYSSLGKQNGMLLGIKAEQIEIKNDEEIIKKDNIIVGIYNKSLTKRGEYNGLIGIEILN